MSVWPWLAHAFIRSEVLPVWFWVRSDLALFLSVRLCALMQLKHTSGCVPVPLL